MAIKHLAKEQMEKKKEIVRKLRVDTAALEKSRDELEKNLKNVQSQLNTEKKDIPEDLKHVLDMTIKQRLTEGKKMVNEFKSQYKPSYFSRLYKSITGTRSRRVVNNTNNKTKGNRAVYALNRFGYNKQPLSSATRKQLKNYMEGNNPLQANTNQKSRRVANNSNNKTKGNRSIPPNSRKTPRQHAIRAVSAPNRFGYNKQPLSSAMHKQLKNYMEGNIPLQANTNQKSRRVANNYNKVTRISSTPLSTRFKRAISMSMIKPKSKPKNSIVPRKNQLKNNSDFVNEYEDDRYD